MKKNIFVFSFLVCLMSNVQAQKATNLTFMNNKTDSLDLSLQENMTEIPMQVFQYKQLKYLNLSLNDLNSLPKEIGQLKNLVYLDLSLNNFAILPKEIAKLKKLKILDLRKTRISDVEILKVTKMLPKCEIKI